MLKDLLAQGGGRRTNTGGILANARDRPTSVAAVTGRYVLRHGSVSAVVARAQMRGNALALQEDLDRARRQPRLDLGAGKEIGHAVEVIVELDVVIDADATQAPLGQNIGFARQELWFDHSLMGDIARNRHSAKAC